MTELSEAEKWWQYEKRVDYAQKCRFCDKVDVGFLVTRHGKACCPDCQAEVHWARYERRPKSLRVLPGKAEKALQDYLMKLEKEKPILFTYRDNFRIALKSNPIHVRFYEHLKSGGCCGFWDADVELDGNVYLIGWNYGH